MAKNGKRRVKYGLCLGSSDLIGWTIREITPDMVEKKVAVFTPIQVKGKTDIPTESQNNFIQSVITSGGYPSIAENAERALKIIP